MILEKPSIGQDPIQNLDYEAFHRVVGVEMDRLEIRLNATLERLLTPIRNEVSLIDFSGRSLEKF